MAALSAYLGHAHVSDTYWYLQAPQNCWAISLRPLRFCIGEENDDFLEHLEKQRENCARTRNSRLAAIKTFFRFLEYRLPSCLDQARRVRAIPVKKTDEVIVGYLNW